MSEDWGIDQVSYCRIGEFDSDVYVIRHVNGSLVCYCDLGDNSHLLEQGMIDHLEHHQEIGHRVPQRALDRLKAERDGKPYKTDVELAMEEFREFRNGNA